MYACVRVRELKQNGTNNVAHKITNKLKLIIFFLFVHVLLYRFGRVLLVFSFLILLFAQSIFFSLCLSRNFLKQNGTQWMSEQNST